MTCVRAAVSDVVLAKDSEVDADLPPVRTVPARISSLESLSHDVLEVTMRTPPSTRLRCLPGQHVEVSGAGGVRRSYSVANVVGDAGLVVLHIRKVDGGQFSDYWFGHAKVDDLLRFRGPLGTFFVRADDDRPLVFLATGTGVAPVNAMLGDVAARNPARAVTVLYGARSKADLYWSPDAGWPAHWRHIPVLSRPDATWTGARGYVQDVLLAQHPDVANVQVYACGSEAMVTSARAALSEQGLPPDEFFEDAFVSSAPTIEAAS